MLSGIIDRPELERISQDPEPFQIIVTFLVKEWKDLFFGVFNIFEISLPNDANSSSVHAVMRPSFSSRFSVGAAYIDQDPEE